MNESGKDSPQKLGSTPASGRRPFEPQTFGKYFLLDPVAVGGMAEVFMAKTFGHSGFQKVLVIKRILPHFASSPEFIDMFVDEAKLSVELTHPNIVQIYDFGKIDDSFFIAMESVAGKDVKSIMRRLAERSEHMAQELVAYIAHEVAKGLDYAHKVSDPVGLPLNIVHRDISPSNILLSYGGHVKIVDFGIAKAESARQVSESGVIKGKFQYMSPEQSQGEALDHRSDIFSLGICLWEMLTGHRLFKRQTDIESLEAVRACQVPLPSSYNPQISPELDRICMVALAKKPDHRYATAGHMQRELEQFLLPSTPSGLATHTSTWIHQRFGEEIRQERERLDRGTERAQNLRPNEDTTSWTMSRHDFPTPRSSTTETVQRSKVTRRRKPSINWLLIASLTVVILLMACVVALLVVPIMPGPATTQSFATLDVRVLPAGVKDVEIFLDGDPVPALYDQVAPGVAHRLSITAPGYEPRETSGLELVSGQVYVKEVQLQPSRFDIVSGPDPTAVQEPLSSDEQDFETEEDNRDRSVASAHSSNFERDIDPEGDARVLGTTAQSNSSRPRAFLDAAAATDNIGAKTLPPPLVIFRSEPSGARIFVDGRKEGVTPLEWSAYNEDRLYKVEFRREGHASVQAVVTSPRRGEQTVLKRALPEKVAANSGTLSIQVNPGYARIFIDDTYVGTTPLIDHSLPEGDHEIRVSNPLQEIDATEVVTIRAGRHTRRDFDFAQ